MYFEVKNNRIERKNTNENQLEYIDPKICYFKFTTKEWSRKEKYVIFWTEKNKSIIKSLGSKCKAKINTAKDINPKKFTIQVYINEDIKTNKYSIGIPFNNEKQEKQCIKPKTASLIYEVYKQLDKKIDNILYIDNTLNFYSEDKIIKSIDLVNKDLIEKILEGKIDLSIDDELSLESKNAVENKVITEELNKKQDISKLPKVAQTGDYNDLENIPTEFNPKHHNHVVVDVVDYEENIEFDLGRLLDNLYDEITKE